MSSTIHDYPTFLPGQELPAQIVNWIIEDLQGVAAGAGLQVVDARTDSFTLALTDARKWIPLENASGKTVTIPPYADVALPVSTQIAIEQRGAGTVTIEAGVGVTIDLAAGLAATTADQGAVVYLTKTEENTWVLTGDATGGTPASADLADLADVSIAAPANGQVLTYSDGAWVNGSVPSTGTVTSVGLSGGATGLSVSGSPVTTSGTMTLSGTLAVANGGTGGTTQATARSGIGAAASGAVASSGLTMATNRLLGRTTASTGAVEEITPDSTLRFTSQALRALGGAGVVNVLDYGAVGDGTTNDYAAIAAAIATGKTVFFPPLTYALGSGLVVSTAGQALIGYGATLKKTASFDCITVSGERARVVGLLIDGDSQGLDGITVTGDRIIIRDVSVRECRDGFVVYGPGAVPGADLNILSGCEAYGNSASGFYLYNATDTTISDCISQTNGANGIYIVNQSYSAKIVNCVIDDNNRAAGGNDGISATGADSLCITNCVVTNTQAGSGGGHGIHLDADSADQDGLRITSSVLAQNAAYGIRVGATGGNTTNRAVIMGNRFVLNGSGTVQVVSGCTYTIIVGNDFSGVAPSDSGSNTVYANNDTNTGGGGSGSITASGYTQATNRILGRTTASSGAIEEISVGAGLSFSSGVLSAAGSPSGGASMGAADLAPTLTDFSWVNQGGASATQYGYGVTLVGVADTTPQIRGLFRALPASSNYTVRTRLAPSIPGKNYHHAGVAWRESSSGKIHMLALVYDSASQSGSAFWCRRFTNPTTYSSDDRQLPMLVQGPALWMRLRDDGTNRYFEYGPDGNNWITFFSLARTTFLTPDEAGFFMLNENAATPNLNGVLTTFDWTQA